MTVMYTFRFPIGEKITKIIYVIGKTQKMKECKNDENVYLKCSLNIPVCFVSFWAQYNNYVIIKIYIT